MVLITRGVIVSLLVFVSVLFGGAVFFHDSEAGMQVITIAAFLISSALQAILGTRERRGGQRKS